MKYFVNSIILMLVFILLMGSQDFTSLPKSGVWYCDALQLQLSFEDDQNCHIVIDGETWYCTWENDRGSRFIAVYLTDSPTAPCSTKDPVFCGDCIKFNSQEMWVIGHDSGTEYVFTRRPD